MATATQWSYIRNGDQHGPVTSSHLKAIADAGELAPYDLVCKGGTTHWVTADKVNGLFSQHIAPPPLPSSNAPAIPKPQTGQIMAAKVVPVKMDGIPPQRSTPPPLASSNGENDLFDWINANSSAPHPAPRSTKNASNKAAAGGTATNIWTIAAVLLLLVGFVVRASSRKSANDEDTTITNTGTTDQTSPAGGDGSKAGRGNNRDGPIVEWPTGFTSVEGVRVGPYFSKGELDDIAGKLIQNEIKSGWELQRVIHVLGKPTTFSRTDGFLGMSPDEKHKMLNDQLVPPSVKSTMAEVAEVCTWDCSDDPDAAHYIMIGFRNGRLISNDGAAGIVMRLP